MDKPIAPSCEKNKSVILNILNDLLKDKKKVLEIGSGTGQHAVFFSEHMPHLVWQTSDLEDKHPGINTWIKDSMLSNVLSPLSINVDYDDIPKSEFDSVFTANTCHIMGWKSVLHMIEKVGTSLPSQGLFIIYGPFNFEGKYTSKSNKAFDEKLKSENPVMGIRNFEDFSDHIYISGKCQGFFPQRHHLYTDAGNVQPDFRLPAIIVEASG